MLQDMENGTSSTSAGVSTHHNTGGDCSQPQGAHSVAHSNAQEQKRPRSRSRASKRKSDASVSSPQSTPLAKEQKDVEDATVPNTANPATASVSSTVLEHEVVPIATDVQVN